jgi:hypothetical protein
LAEAVFVAHRRRIDERIARNAAEFVEGVQARIVVFEEGAAVQLIRAVLRNDFYLRAAVATVFGGIAGRGDAHLLDRFLTRRHDRAAAPT